MGATPPSSDSGQPVRFEESRALSSAGFYHLLRSHRRKLLLLKLNPDCGLPSCLRRWLCLAGSARLLSPGSAPGAGFALSFRILLNSTQCISELRLVGAEGRSPAPGAEPETQIGWLRRGKPSPHAGRQAVTKLVIHSKGAHGWLARAANPENRSDSLFQRLRALLPYPVSKKRHIAGYKKLDMILQDATGLVPWSIRACLTTGR